MNTRRLAALCALVSLILLPGGCPQNGTNEPSALSGTWTGELDCTSTQSIDGGEGVPFETTRDVALTFDDDGRPTGLPVLGFSNAPTQTTGINEVGETETLTSQSGTLTITRVLTVRSATYTANTARVIIDIDYEATGGALTQTGTGVLTVFAEIANGALDVTLDVDYDITQSADTLSFDTTETLACDGALN